ncbi:hypothetical protein [Hymenobacter sp. IS2118]|uniref:hypothetical protein n=1 Tax=Hymenobacter sp. IS2118 TaxID=1505605 RepID=UPI0005565935|nr:hypothetical protein [Hymenobacter sp. IS2118]
MLAAGLLVSAMFALPALGQTAAPVPSFYNTYHYTAYTVFDNTSSAAPTEVRGVGGSLTLRPDGTYEKHFSIVASSGPHYFNQSGRFILAGDSIRFAFTDLKGADVQRGTFRFVPATKRLTLTIIGYPTGNQGVYELVAAAPATAPAPPPTIIPKRAKKQRK